jgi:hypothetical protein
MSSNSSDALINMSFLFNVSSDLKTAATSDVKQSPRPWDFGEITLLILLIFGTIGNMLTIMVMRTKRMRNSNASMFIISMAISDIILLVLKFTANMIKIYRMPIYNFCIIIQVIPQAASFISVWLIVITSAERTCAVLTPLKVAYLFSKKHCKVIMSLMFAFFITLSGTTSVCIHYSKAQPYYCQIRGNKEGKCFIYYTYIFPWLKSAFGSWIPSIIGIVLNLVIICELYKASNARRAITNNHYKSTPSGNHCGESSINNMTVNVSNTGGNSVLNNRARHVSLCASSIPDQQMLDSASSPLKDRSLMLDLEDESQLKKMSFEFEENRMIGNGGGGGARSAANNMSLKSLPATRNGGSVYLKKKMSAANMSTITDADGGNVSPHHLSGHAISHQSSHGNSGSSNSKEKQITIM